MQRALSQAALCRLDCAGHLPSLADADDAVLLDPAFFQRVDDGADACRVDAHLVQQAGCADLCHQVGDFLNVLPDALDQHQVTVRLEVAEPRRLCLAASQHDGMRPRLAPREPVAGAPVAPKCREAQQVVQAAAVDADRDHFAALDQRREGQPAGCLRLPVVRAGPSVRPEVQADLDVQVLGEERLTRPVRLVLDLLDLVLQPFSADRPPDVRVRDVVVRRVKVALGLHDRRREFVQHAQRLGIDDLAVAHVAVVVQLLAEDPGRRFVALRCEVDHPALFARHLAAGGLHEHGLGVRALAEDPVLINQNPPRLLAGDCLGVRGHNLQACPVDPVRDRANVVLYVEQGRQLFVCPDHPGRRLEAVVCDFLCGGEDQVFLFLAPAEDQRRQHDPGGDGRLRVLLADQQVELADQLPPCLGIVGAEDRGHEVEHPLVAALAERRPPRQINDPQLLEDGERLRGLVGVDRRRDDGPAVNQALLPIGAGRGPLHQLPTTFSGGRAGPKRPLATLPALACVSSFLPPSPFFMCRYCAAAMAALT